MFKLERYSPFCLILESYIRLGLDSMSLARNQCYYLSVEEQTKLNGPPSSDQRYGSLFSHVSLALVPKHHLSSRLWNSSPNSHEENSREYPRNPRWRSPIPQRYTLTPDEHNPKTLTTSKASWTKKAYSENPVMDKNFKNGSKNGIQEKLLSILQEQIPMWSLELSKDGFLNFHPLFYHHLTISLLHSNPNNHLVPHHPSPFCSPVISRNLKKSSYGTCWSTSSLRMLYIIIFMWLLLWTC